MEQAELQVTCGCGKRYRVNPDWAGRRLHCRSCSKQIQVHVPDPAVAAPAPKPSRRSSSASSRRVSRRLARKAPQRTRARTRLRTRPAAGSQGLLLAVLALSLLLVGVAWRVASRGERLATVQARGNVAQAAKAAKETYDARRAETYRAGDRYRVRSTTRFDYEAVSAEPSRGGRTKREGADSTYLLEVLSADTAGLPTRIRRTYSAYVDRASSARPAVEGLVLTQRWSGNRWELEPSSRRLPPPLAAAIEAEATDRTPSGTASLLSQRAAVRLPVGKEYPLPPVVATTLLGTLGFRNAELDPTRTACTAQLRSATPTPDGNRLQLDHRIELAGFATLGGKRCRVAGTVTLSESFLEGGKSAEFEQTASGTLTVHVPVGDGEVEIRGSLRAQLGISKP